MLEQQQKPGCGLTPATIVAIAIAFLWMMSAPAILRYFRGAQPKDTRTEEQRREDARKQEAQALRARAKYLREHDGDVKVAEEYERLADKILAGKAGKAGEAAPAATAVGPEAGGAAVGAAAERLTYGVGLPGAEVAGGLAERAGDLPAAPEGPEEPEEPEEEPRRIGPVETEELRLEFNTLGGSLERAALRKYHFKPGKDQPPLDMLLPLGGLGGASNSFVLRARGSLMQTLTDLSRRTWKVEDSGGFDRSGRRVIAFRKRALSLEFVKTFTIHEKGPLFDVDVEVRNVGGKPTGDLEFDLVGLNGLAPDDRPGRYWSLQATLAGRKAPDESIWPQALTAAKVVADGAKRVAAGEAPEQPSFSPPVKEWLALTGHYFAGIVQILDSDAVEAMYVEPVVFEAGVRYVMADMEVGDRVSHYRQNVSSLAVHEALRRWDAGVRVKDADRFERSRIGDSDFIVRKAGQIPIRGADVLLTSDGPSGPGEDYSGDPVFGVPNVALAAELRIGKLAAGESRKAGFRVYLGPLHTGTLAEQGGDSGWDSLVSFGWFGWLSKLLLVLLNGIHFFTRFLGETIGGYGLAIFFLTVAVKGALHPLQRKAMISMHKMQALAPEMKAIKKKYEKDKSTEGRRKMMAETNELYKKHGVSPLGGCLPMLVQLPMFFALFGMLRGAFELRHQGYLWIQDLTQPDNLVSFGSFKLPFLGWDALNLLPALYLGLILLQQHLQPKSEDPQVRQQQSMMKFMMIFFFVIFYTMPSGLVLYFVFSNGIGILEQWYIRKHLIPAAAAAAPGAPGAPTTAPGGASGPAPKTSWDKQADRERRDAEKRRKRQERQDRQRPL